MLRLDGIIIEKSKSKQFDSIMFGDGCTDTCGSNSNEEDASSSSSLVEGAGGRRRSALAAAVIS